MAATWPSFLCGFTVLYLINGALSALTTTPSNVIIAKGQDVYMECSTDAAAGTTGINWRFDGSEVVEDCTSSDTSRFSVSSPTTNDCFITGHANTVSGNQGPYHCSDGSTVQAEAVAILIDPTPTCAVVTSPPIRDQEVTLSCVVTYINKGDEAHVNPRAVMSASVSWESAAGTVLSSSSTDLPDDVGETLQVDVVQVATGTEIPSYTCTASFTFTDRPSSSFMYALNELSWPCVSEPVRTWYCPTSATVTPSSGPFKTGDVLKCEADGYPLFYTWTDSNGNVVSSTSSVTIINPGEFTLTCSAAGNFTTPCEATSSVSGNATGSCTEQALLACNAKIPQYENLNTISAVTEFCIQASEYLSCLDALACTESDALYPSYLQSYGIADTVQFVCRNDTLTELADSFQQCPLEAVPNQTESCYASSFPDDFIEHSVDEICQYTRNVYSCMNDWLMSINCTSRIAVATVMEAIDRLVGPFASNYNCSVVPGDPTTTVAPDTGSALSTGAIAGIVAGLVLLVLLLLALIFVIWLYIRRKLEEGRPRNVAFYQAVRAGRPAKLGCRGKENPYWMTDAHRPRSIDHQVYGNYCGLGNCYSPRYSQQSVPMSPVWH